MEYPFLGNHWYRPSRSRYFPAVRVPVRRPVGEEAMTVPVAPKVVSIPVHFVGSEDTHSASALKIQTAFRGFLVRKSLKKIAAIRSEVDEIEQRILQREMEDLIRRDNRERLKVIEKLMALLFKLDCIRGVDSGVRDCRRAVIKKAIALQEKVDAIVADAAAAAGTLGLASEDPTRLQESGDVSSRNTLEYIDSADPSVQADNFGNCVEGKFYEIESHDNTSCCDIVVDKIVELEGVHESGEPMTDVQDPNIDSLANNCEKIESIEGGTDVMAKAEDEPCIEKVILENRVTTSSETESLEENMETNPVKELSEHPMNSRNLIEEGEELESKEVGCGMEMQESDVKGCLVDAGGKDGNMQNRELLERITEDNKKMMHLMLQLFDKNEKQTQMLNSLTQRVEQLEKAFLCDRLRKKKKNNGA